MPTTNYKITVEFLKTFADKVDNMSAQEPTDDAVDRVVIANCYVGAAIAERQEALVAVLNSIAVSLNSIAANNKADKTTD